MQITHLYTGLNLFNAMNMYILTSSCRKHENKDYHYHLSILISSVIKYIMIEVGSFDFPLKFTEYSVILFLSNVLKFQHLQIHTVQFDSIADYTSFNISNNSSVIKCFWTLETFSQAIPGSLLNVNSSWNYRMWTETFRVQSNVVTR